MPRTKKKATARKKKPASRRPAKKPARRNKPPPRQSVPKMVIRRNAALAATADLAPERRPLLERYQNMDGAHLTTGVGAAALGSVVGVLVAGKGWMEPKTAGWALTGTGAGTTAVGYYFDADHLMAAGAGLTAAGALSLANQYSVDAFETIVETAEKHRERLLEEARTQGQSGQVAQTRNRLVIVERATEDDDYAGYEDAA